MQTRHLGHSKNVHFCLVCMSITTLETGDSITKVSSQIYKYLVV